MFHSSDVHSSDFHSSDFHSSSESARKRRSYSSHVIFTAARLRRRKSRPTACSNSSSSASARAGESLSPSASISASAARNNRLASASSHRSFNFKNLGVSEFASHYTRNGRRSRPVTRSACGFLGAAEKADATEQHHIRPVEHYGRLRMTFASARRISMRRLKSFCHGCDKSVERRMHRRRAGTGIVRSRLVLVILAGSASEQMLPQYTQMLYRLFPEGHFVFRLAASRRDRNHDARKQHQRKSHLPSHNSFLLAARLFTSLRTNAWQNLCPLAGDRPY